ncbi:MAG TPA: MerR family DNA-binding protein [Candidatus Babeliales bacterium]|nr:MerR family DNA-binding protein [Candidatus Babeliales bacterium]
MRDLTIGKIAKYVGISCDAIRMYERQRLIEEPERASNGYRIYPESVIARLQFIQQAKAMGFSLKEIGELLAIKHTAANTCDQVRTEAQAKLQNIEKKITELQRLKKAIGILIQTCNEKHDDNHCPLLDALERENRKGGRK